MDKNKETMHENSNQTRYYLKLWMLPVSISVFSTAGTPKYWQYMASWYFSYCEYRIWLVMYITPLWGGFPSSIARPTNRVPIPNETYSESSRRDASNAVLLGTRHYIRLWRYRPWKIGAGGCNMHSCRTPVVLLRIKILSTCAVISEY